MKSISFGRGLCLGFLGLAGVTHADSPRFHLGAELGYQHLSTAVPDEVSKKGYEALMKAGALFGDAEWELQTDLGFRYSFLSGSLDNVSHQIKFLSGWAEISPRYRFDKEWSLGPQIDFGFGTDMTHTEIPESGQSLLTMIGLSTRYAIADEPLSLTFRITTDTNLKDQKLVVASLGLLWHFGSEGKAAVEAAPPPPPEEVTAPRAQVEVTANYILLRIPEDVLLFETGMSHLEKHQKEYIGRLGSVLAQHSDRWKKIEVSGHTDYRGSDALNNELSEGRAKSVKNELLASGLQENQISWFGRGETQPLTTKKDEQSLAKNRRVEIKIDGVVEGSDLAEELVSISPLGPTGN
ncbi:MAG: OmpA family protein [Bdellovibrionota bacterium]